MKRKTKKINTLTAVNHVKQHPTTVDSDKCSERRHLYIFIFILAHVEPHFLSVLVDFCEDNLHVPVAVLNPVGHGHQQLVLHHPLVHLDQPNV